MELLTTTGLTTGHRKRVVILGAGFAGLYTALKLDRLLRRDDVADIVLIDKNHFHLFTPMLHEAAAGIIQP